MKTLHTRYGALPIPESRDELDSWDMDQALAWLALNDPNGEWSQYIRNFEWAACELGPLELEDVLDEVWEQTQDT